MAVCRTLLEHTSPQTLCNAARQRSYARQSLLQLPHPRGQMRVVACAVEYVAAPGTWSQPRSPQTTAMQLHPKLYASQLVRPAQQPTYPLSPRQRRPPLRRQWLGQALWTTPQVRPALRIWWQLLQPGPPQLMRQLWSSAALLTLQQQIPPLTTSLLHVLHATRPRLQLQKRLQARLQLLHVRLHHRLPHRRAPPRHHPATMQ